MHHWCIALTSLPLLQRQQPIRSLCRTRHDTRPRRCTWMMFFCHGGTKRCLEEVKIVPPHPTFLEPVGHGAMSHTQRHQPTTPSAETIPTKSSNHELIDGMVSAPGGVGWCHCEFLWSTQQKLMLLAIAGSRWENSWFGVKFQTQLSTKIPLESSHQGLFIGVIQIWCSLCQIIRL
jgi:hypothetical protein